MNLNQIIQVENEVIPYNPEITIWKKIYCFGHFLLLLIEFFHFEFDRGQLSHFGFNLKLAFFVTTMQSLGAFFDRKFVALIFCTFRSQYFTSRKNVSNLA